ncbi:enoyl-CoA hydratase/isomerase family protein [Roseomonas chloroacetimidivorans]|jgi:2-(1,2-epoxy-1,2-dihydrophenyl)acetyl-CoA isomerase|uniref:enoyl-CoA hydratase/isomerase family protein n=1 Tax=Roseomonas chloroacetimidivorans TaxID=1766656 RepID=UPI003C7814B7
MTRENEPQTDGYEAVRWAMDDGIGVLTLHRPEKRNALNARMREEIADVVARVRQDRALKALVINGAGGAFCAGGDLAALEAVRGDLEGARARIRALHTWFPELVNLEKPVIAAVDGPAFGAGFMLALAADFVLASSRASFCAVFARIGLVPDLGAFWLLPRILGLQRAKELAMTARTVGVDEARSLGIVLEIHPPEQLMHRAMAFAGRFRHASTVALGMTKSAMNQSFNLDQRALAEMEAFAQAIAINGSDHRAAVDCFLSKQPLDFDWDRMDREEGAR